MTEISRPWVGTTTGDAGPYSADQWAQLYRDAFNASDPDGVILIGSGVAPEPGLSVVPKTPASMQLTVKAGAGLVHGTYYNLDADATVTIGGNASGQPRIDSVILRKDWALQTIRLAVLQGTPAVSPVPPTLTQTAGVTWESSLADVTVANGAVSLAASVISPRSTFANAGQNIYIPDIKNVSGGTLTTGDVVVWDNAGSGGVKKLDPIPPGGTALYIAGVWVGRTANNGYGHMLVRGIGYVKTNAALNVNFILIPHPTIAGVATAVTQALGFGATSAFSANLSIGRALETTTGAGLIKAYVDIPPYIQRSYNYSAADNNANYTTASAAFALMTGATFTPIVQGAAGNGLLVFTLQGVCEHTVSGALIHFDVNLNGGGFVNTPASSAIGTFANGIYTVRAPAANVPFPVFFQCPIQVGVPGAIVSAQPLWKTTAATASMYAGAGGATNDIPLILMMQEQ